MGRVFISLDLPGRVKEKILYIQKKLPEFIGKNTKFENLHLTLKFLGEIPDEKIKEVKNKLSETNFGQFEARISSLGVFSRKHIRIIWLKLENADELQKIVDHKLNEIGFQKERRFMGHITIGRVKSLKSSKKEFIGKLDSITFAPIKFIVKSFSLVESNLFHKGPVYKSIKEYALI